MALSDAAVREIAKVLRKHVDQKMLAQIVDELLESRRQGFPRRHRKACARAAVTPQHASNTSAVVHTSGIKWFKERLASATVLPGKAGVSSCEAVSVVPVKKR